jgi:hypothetical protein
MPIRIDMSGVTEAGGNFPALEPGVYPAHVSECRLSDKPGPSGYHYIVMVYEAEESTKRHVWRNYSLSPGALGFLKKDLVALGVDVPEGEFELEPADVVGSKCQIRVSKKPHYSRPNEEDNELEEVIPSSQEFSWSN